LNNSGPAPQFGHFWRQPRIMAGRRGRSDVAMSEVLVDDGMMESCS
jgi:hypothetical protein